MNVLLELLGVLLLSQLFALTLAELFDKSFFMTAKDIARSKNNWYWFIFLFNWTVLFPLTLNNYLMIKNIRKHNKFMGIV